MIMNLRRLRRCELLLHCTFPGIVSLQNSDLHYCIIYSNSTQPIVLSTILEEMKKMRSESAMHNKAMVDNYAKMTDNYKKMNKAVCDLVEQSFQIDSSPYKVHIILTSRIVYMTNNYTQG